MLDSTVNYGAHVKFVNKWLERLEEEEKQANAPPPREPGLITEPGLATDESDRDPQGDQRRAENAGAVAPQTPIDGPVHTEAAGTVPAVEA